MKLSGPFRLGDYVPEQVNVTPAASGIPSQPIITDAFGPANNYNNPTYYDDGELPLYNEPGLLKLDDFFDKLFGTGHYFYNKDNNAFYDGSGQGQNFDLFGPINHAGQSLEDFLKKEQNTLLTIGGVVLVGVIGIAVLPSILRSLFGDGR